MEAAGPGASAFDAGAREAVAPAAEAKPVKRASTILGIGAIGRDETSPTEAPAAPAALEVVEPPPPEPAAAPEERTMMKQAAELLQQALAEAGGSLDEVGIAAVAKPEPKAEPVAAPAQAATVSEAEPQATEPAATEPAATEPANQEPDASSAEAPAAELGAEPEAPA